MNRARIDTLEARREFVGQSLKNNYQAMLSSEETSSTRNEQTEMELLPVIVRLISPVPEASKLLTLFGSREDLTVNGSHTISAVTVTENKTKTNIPADEKRQSSNDSEHDLEHFRILTNLGILIGELSPSSLEKLLEAGLVQKFSWDLEELVYFKRSEKNEESKNE